jgi:rhodanese-related sulfurtransferase
VDIRDIRELEEGRIPGAFHAPLVMLEFWVDPAVPFSSKSTGQEFCDTASTWEYSFV